MSWLLLPLALACFTETTTEGDEPELHEEGPPGWGSGSDDDTGDGGSGSGSGGGSGSGSGSGSGGSGGSGDPDTDNDGDGWGADEDCDDSDSQVHPGVDEDGCDGVDEDCDGAVDEDFDGDSYERNDDDGGTSLGDLTDDDATVVAYLNPEDDEDYFLFYVEDSNWDWFGITVDLKVPSGIDLVMELWFYPDDGNDWEVIDVMDDGGKGRDELIEWGGGSGSDDSGWYAVLVYSAEGASCEGSYSLDIEA